jgi:MFS family permease
MASCYALAYGIMQVPVGIIADKYGVKQAMIFATLLCALATFLFAHAVNFEQAAAMRFLMGLGSAFAFVCLLVVASVWFPTRFFGLFAGLSQFVGTLGPVLAGGPLVAFLAKTGTPWRAALTDVAMIGVVLGILTLLFVRNKPKTYKGAPPYLSNDASPMWPRLKKLVRNKQVWVVAFYSGTVYVSIAIMGVVWGTDYLQTRGIPHMQAAGFISVAWMAYAIACPLLGVCSDLTRRRKPYLVFSAVLGLVSTAALVYLPHLHLALYMLIFVALGIAAAGQNLGFVAITEHADVGAKATALGLNNGIMTVFTGLAPVIIGSVLGGVSHGSALNWSAHDFMIGLSLMPIMYVLAILISVVGFKETYCQRQC